MLKLFALRIQNWQNYAAFDHGNLAVWRYQRLAHTNSIQDCALSS